MSFLDRASLSGSSAAAAGGEATSKELFDKGVESLRLANDRRAYFNAREVAYDRRIKAIEAATGQTRTNPMRQIMPAEDVPYGEFAPQMLDPRAVVEFDGWLKDLAEQRPELRDIIKPDVSIDFEAAQISNRAEEADAETWSRAAPGIGKYVPWFAGQAIYALTDPLNVVAGLAGGSARTGVKGMAWGALKAAAANMALEAVNQPFVQDWRRQAGLDYGVSQAALNVGAAGALGFGLDFAGRGAYRGAQRAVGREAVTNTDGFVTGYRWPGGDASPTDLLDDAARTAPPDSNLAKAAAGDEDAIRAVAAESGLDKSDALVRGALSELEKAKIFGPDPGVDRVSHERVMADALERANNPAALPPPDATLAPEPARPYPQTNTGGGKFPRNSQVEVEVEGGQKIRPKKQPIGRQRPPIDGEERTIYVTPDDAFRLRRGLKRNGDVREDSDLIFDRPDSVSLVRKGKGERIATASRPVPGMVPVVRGKNGKWKILNPIETVRRVAEEIDGKPVYHSFLPRQNDEPDVLLAPEGGTSIVFEAADGRYRVMRREQITPEQEIYRVALHFREADGWTIDDARVFAARKALEEMSGSAIDMATLLRWKPSLADRTLPLSDYKMQQALGLAKLSDEAFGAVARGDVPPNFGALVGSRVKDKGQHAGLIAEMSKENLASERMAKAWLGQRLAGPVSPTDHMTRLGLQRQAFMRQRVQVLDEAFKQLEKDRRFLAAVDRESPILRQSGNEMDEVANRERRYLAGKVAGIIQQLATAPGLVDDLLQRAALEVSSGVKPADAARGFVAAVTDILEEQGVDGLVRTVSRAETELVPQRMSKPNGPEAKAQAQRLKREAAARKKLEAEEVWKASEGLFNEILFIREMDNLPKPTRLIDWLISRGGVFDPTGDVRGMLGSPKARPGLLRSKDAFKRQKGMLGDADGTAGLDREAGKPDDALTLDDAALAAWEEGYLVGGERPEINDLLDAIAKDLYEPVYSNKDADLAEGLAAAEASRTELDRLGVLGAKTVEEVRDRLASDPEALSRALGKAPQEPAGKDAAAQPGASRNQTELDGGDDDLPPFALGGEDLSRRAIEFQIKAGRTAEIRREVVDASLAAINDLQAVAGDVPMGVLTRFEPLEKAADPKVRAHFETADGRTFTITAPWSVLTTIRGGFFPTLRAVAFFRTSLGDTELFRFSQRGEAWHELGHVFFRELGVEDRGKLARHADGLGVLDYTMAEYAELIGRPELNGKQTLRDAYIDRYSANYKTADEAFAKVDEEAVMHMAELYYHGQLTAADVAAVEPILRKLFKGRMPDDSLDDLPAMPPAMPTTDGTIANMRAAIQQSDDDAYWEGVAREAAVFELRGEDAPRVFQAPVRKSILAMDAETLEKSVAEFEEKLARGGATAEETAQKLTERFGFAIDPKDLAEGRVWWRDPEAQIFYDEPGLRGRLSRIKRWTADVKSAAQKMWADGVTSPVMAKRLADEFGIEADDVAVRQLAWLERERFPKRRDVRPVTDEDVATASKLWNSDAPLSEIAVKIGRNTSAVTAIARNNRAKFPTRSNHMTEVQRAEILRLYPSSTIRYVAKAVGVSEPAVTAVARKAGLGRKQFWTPERIVALEDDAIVVLNNGPAAKILSEKFGVPVTEGMVEKARARNGLSMSAQERARLRDEMALKRTKETTGIVEVCKT